MTIWQPCGPAVPAATYLGFEHQPQGCSATLLQATSQSAHSTLHRNGLHKIIRPPLLKCCDPSHWNAFLPPLHSSSLLPSQISSLQCNRIPHILREDERKAPPTPISIFEMTPEAPHVQTFPEGCQRKVWHIENTKASWLCKEYESPSIHHLEVDC